MWALYEKERRRICKGKTWRVRSYQVRDRANGNSGIILDCRLVKRRVGGAEPGLQSIRRQAQAGRERTCPKGCPDICLSAGATSVVGSKGVVKLNIDPIVRSETGQGPE